MKKTLVGAVVAAIVLVGSGMGSMAGASTVFLDPPPPRPTTPCSESELGCTVTVKGDSLWRIAQQVCGARLAATSGAVAALYDANRDVIGANRNRLRVGTTLAVSQACFTRARPVVSVTKDDPTAIVAPGTRLDLSLQVCRSSCGDEWRVLSTPRAVRFRTEVRVPEPPRPEGAEVVVGGSNTDIFVFDAVRRGRGTVVLGLFGPGQSTAEETLRLTVVSR